MGDAGHDQPVEIAEDRLEGLALLRRGRRQLRNQLARQDPGLHRQLALGEPLAVGRDPLHERVPGAAKLVRCHGNLLALALALARDQPPDQRDELVIPAGRARRQPVLPIDNERGR